MGISGLLQLLAPATQEMHIKVYAGKKVGVDSYGWLHRGAYGCATELAMNKKTSLPIQYCMKRLAMLKHYGVIPVIVLDGRNLPSKKEEEQQRQRSRQRHLHVGREYLRAGNRSKALEHFQRSIDITPEIGNQLVRACKAANIEVIVAPYEADAQLAFLERSGYVSAVITEDSDLLVYGCSRVVFKMNEYGSGQEIRLQRLFHGAQVSPGINFMSWSQRQFRRMCILAGCDYLSSPTGMGLKTAYKMIKIHDSIDKILEILAARGMQLPSDYKTLFSRAELTFEYQPVFDPITQTLRRFGATTQDSYQAHLDVAGPMLEQDVARRLCTGEVNPITLETFAVDDDASSTGAALIALRKAAAAVDASQKQSTLHRFFDQRNIHASLETGYTNTLPIEKQSMPTSQKSTAALLEASEVCAVTSSARITTTRMSLLRRQDHRETTCVGDTQNFQHTNYKMHTQELDSLRYVATISQAAQRSFQPPARRSIPTSTSPTLSGTADSESKLTRSKSTSECLQFYRQQKQRFHGQQVSAFRKRRAASSSSSSTPRVVSKFFKLDQVSNTSSIGNRATQKYPVPNSTTRTVSNADSLNLEEEDRNIQSPQQQMGCRELITEQKTDKTSQSGAASTKDQNSDSMNLSVQCNERRFRDHNGIYPIDVTHSTGKLEGNQNSISKNRKEYQDCCQSLLREDKAFTNPQQFYRQPKRNYRAHEKVGDSGQSFTVANSKQVSCSNNIGGSAQATVDLEQYIRVKPS